MSELEVLEDIASCLARIKVELGGIGFFAVVDAVVQKHGR